MFVCVCYDFPKESSAVSYKPAKQRVAHVQKSNTPAGSLPRPRIPVEYGAKVPQSQRQRYLDRIVDEYLRICSTEKEAFEKVTLLKICLSYFMRLTYKVINDHHSEFPV